MPECNKCVILSKRFSFRLGITYINRVVAPVQSGSHKMGVSPQNSKPARCAAL